MCDLKTATLVLLVVIMGCFLLERKIRNVENYEMYRQKPYGYVKTGSMPLTFYERPRYRKPYRYPFQIEKSYPIKHMSYLE